MEFLSSLLQNIGSGLMNLLVYAAIVLIFILGVIKCILPVLRNRAILKNAIRNIRMGSAARQSWQEDSFLGKGGLSAHWTEYLNNLFFADGVYHNASNVEDYINEETVIYGPGRSMFAEAVPSVLVSIGFLGTLIGLAQGLSGFDMSDSEAVMSSIVTLIPGMRYAFMTSIFGVIGSVGFNLITKGVNGSTEHTLRDFYGAMSSHAGVLSVDPMTQVAIYQQEQTALIRKLVDTLETGVADSVANAMEPLNQSLRSFVSVTTKDQMRFLDAVVGRFIDRMDDMLGGQMKRFSRALDETARFQEGALENVKSSLSDTTLMLDSIRQVTRICDDMVRSNAAYIESLRANQQQTDDAFSRVASSIEQMELVARQQNGYLKTVSAMQAEITRSVEQMTAACRAFSEDSADSAADMAKSANEIRAAGAHLEAIHRDCVAAINTELKTTLDAYQDYVNRFGQHLDHVTGALSDSVANLPRAVNEASNQFLDQMDRLTETIEEADRRLADSARRVGR